MATPQEHDQSEQLHFRITGDQLRQWRETVGMTQKQLAARIHYHQVRICRWERDEERIPTAAYQPLLDALDFQCGQEGERLNVTKRELVTLRAGLATRSMAGKMRLSHG